MEGKSFLLLKKESGWYDAALNRRKAAGYGDG
jgi:hypothetical protein